MQNGELCPGIAWEVLVSFRKSKFLTDSLSQLVGDSYFGMDILCVNQRDREERIGVVQHIPDICRGAQKTIVIREGDGLKQCCAKAAGDFRDWHDEGPETLHKHFEKSGGEHSYGVSESWLQRLWPLQEVLMSDTIQFTTCIEWNPVPEYTGEPYRARLDSKQLFDNLHTISYAWARGYQDQPQGEGSRYPHDFRRALLQNKTTRGHRICFAQKIWVLRPRVNSPCSPTVFELQASFEISYLPFCRNLAAMFLHHRFQHCLLGNFSSTVITKPPAQVSSSYPS